MLHPGLMGSILTIHVQQQTHERLLLSRIVQLRDLLALFHLNNP